MNVERDLISSEQVYDVLIVGAGPVGLATAIALYRRGIENLLVIDRTSEFRRVGQTVDLLPNGLKALQYIDELAYEQVKEAGFEFNKLFNRNNSTDENSKQEKSPHKRAWHHKNLQGKIIRSIPLNFETWFNRYGEGRVSLPWFDLQTTLRNLLPSELVRANHRCVKVTKDRTGMQISCVGDRAPVTNPFAHWERHTPNSSEIDLIDKFTSDSAQKNFRAKLVVAADGMNSTIRQLLYNNSDLSQWAKPQYSDFSAIGCLQIDNIPDEIIQELESKYFQGDRIITLYRESIKPDSQYLEQPRIILIRQQENTLGYLLHAPLSLDSLPNKSAKEIIELAANILEKADFPSIFIRLVNLSNPENLFSRPYYIHPATIPINSKQIWSSGRVVLVGDAAHGMPPFAAQGVNQGFEDAALISTLITKIVKNKAIDDENTIAHEFRTYEQIRRPFMMKIQEATLKNHLWSQQKWEEYSDMVFSRNLQRSSGNLV